MSDERSRQVIRWAIDRGGFAELAFKVFAQERLHLLPSDKGYLEARDIFFNGCAFIFSSVSIMFGDTDSSPEEEEEDMRRMSVVNDELERFDKDYRERVKNGTA